MTCLSSYDAAAKLRKVGLRVAGTQGRGISKLALFRSFFLLSPGSSVPAWKGAPPFIPPIAFSGPFSIYLKYRTLTSVSRAPTAMVTFSWVCLLSEVGHGGGDAANRMTTGTLQRHRFPPAAVSLSSLVYSAHWPGGCHWERLSSHREGCRGHSAHRQNLCPPRSGWFLQPHLAGTSRDLFGPGFHLSPQPDPLTPGERTGRDVCPSGKQCWPQ